MSFFTLIIIARGKEEDLRLTLESLKLEGAEVIVKRKGMANETDAQLRKAAAFEATGEWVHFTTDAVVWGRDYPSHLHTSLAEDCVAFGGPFLPARNSGFLSHSLALALSSPLGSGPTFSRYRSVGEKAKKSSEADIPAENLWVRREFLQLDFVAEYGESDLTRLLLGLHRQGRTILYQPKLWVLGHHRENLLGIRRTFFRRGFERSRMIRELCDHRSVVYTLPALFVVGHIFLLLYPMSLWPLFRITYLLLLFVGIGLSFRARRPWLFPLVTFFQFFVVWEHGWGFVYERVSEWWRRVL